MFRIKVYDFGAWETEPVSDLSDAVEVADQLTGYFSGVERVCEVYDGSRLVYATLSP